MSTLTIAPEIGQVWADNDQRSAGRTLLVTAVSTHGGGTGYVEARVLTNSATTNRLITQGDARDVRGRATRLKAARLRPTRTGYRLLGKLDWWPTDAVVATTPSGDVSGPLPDDDTAVRWLLAREV